MVRLKTDPPRGVLRQTTPPRGQHRHVRYHPSPDLAPFVEHYWIVEWDLGDAPPETVQVLPHPSVHLVIDRQRGARLAGVARGRFVRTLEGVGGVVAAKFRPGGFRPFVTTDIAALVDTEVPLSALFGAGANDLEAAVTAATEDDARIAAIESFLRTRQPIPDPDAERAAQIVYATAGDRGIVRVEDLIERYGGTARSLQRLFAKYVGVPPKWVIRRYRLHEAALQLAEGRMALADLAQTLGYSDQAHFARDFKAAVGESPTAYANRGRT